ncbi:MAG: hypothetical protein AAB316_19020 [Bacteroidota bacterium]
MTEITIHTDDLEFLQKLFALAQESHLEIAGKNGKSNELKLVSPKRKTTKQAVQKVPPIDWGSDPESLRELRGIWKDNPPTLEEIRKLAWGDRL